MRTPKQNNAVYHRSCYKKHNQQKLERAIKKFNKISHKTNNDVEIDISSAPVKRRSMASKHVSKKGICCFCKQNDDNINLRAAGMLHATKVRRNINGQECRQSSKADVIVKVFSWSRVNYGAQNL